MASDFIYEGQQNGHYVFYEKGSGTIYQVGQFYQQGVTPELLDGDEVAIPDPNSPSESRVFSIREDRGLRTMPR